MKKLSSIKKPPSTAEHIAEAIKKTISKKDSGNVKPGVDLTGLAKKLSERREQTLQEEKEETKDKE